jgi:hypothetical protein
MRVFRGWRTTAGLLVMAGLAGALSGCGSSNAVRSDPGSSCVNNAITGSGTYHNEVSVRVTVRNPATHQALYSVRVDLSTSGSAPPVQLTITGPVASHASAVLARKVLTTDPVQVCHVDRIVQLGQY